MNKKEKIDKGFELSYYNLSYRRRFIRTLWMIPFAILVIVTIAYSNYYPQKKIGIIIAIIMVFSFQIRDNYTKMKEEMKSDSYKENI